MGAVAVDDGFEQSSRGDYSGRTLGRSSRISEKKLSFGSPHPPLKSPPMFARISGFFVCNKALNRQEMLRTDALSY